MMVIFVSQCEKKALGRTRNVLDAFANRIGDSTWQTMITQNGLSAVKKSLQRTASKNTSVSCHWLRSRSRSDLLWVVGKKEKFNYQGMVPVNSTSKNKMNNQWEGNWHYLPIIRIATALAALFHDWGKASVCFQNKLGKRSKEADPLRHEWISCLLFYAFVKSQYNNSSEEEKNNEEEKSEKERSNDKKWLDFLVKNPIDEEALRETLKKDQIQYPLDDLPPLARTISWLILSHHRLPLPEKDKCNKYKDYKNYKNYPLLDYKKLFKILDSGFGYKNSVNPKNEFQKNHQKIPIEDCLTFKEGLLSDSSQWVKEIKKWSGKALKQLNSPNGCMESIFEKGLWRIILFHSRLSLMLGDHNYSSEKADERWESSVKLLANTKKKGKGQKLDEHLVNVSKKALEVVNCLPRFENGFPIADDIRALGKKNPEDFAWQDKVVYQIEKWRKSNKYEDSDSQFGFFAVNMASTGKGKTFANAKIMKALSTNKDGLRYTLALGLRTLTLQTGDEYRERLKLNDESHLSVIIGSREMEELHRSKKGIREEISEEETSGSESMEELFDEKLWGGNLQNEHNVFGAGEESFCDSDYECEIPVKTLKTLLTTDKRRKLLYSPILVCTIDHIMEATETTRGGRYILPSLRLMSSDLVIDEVDDFDVNDLKAIGRLIHLAGMLGRKVMISSATIPPDLAKGFFRSYYEGWLLFSKSRNISSNVGCAWVDEFKADVTDDIHNPPCFNRLHDQFTEYRVKKLRKEPIRRKAEIVKLNTVSFGNDESSSSLKESGSVKEKTTSTCSDGLDRKERYYFDSIKETVISLHKRHFYEDKINGKKVSFGVVRMANINPCVNLTGYFLKCEWPDNIEIKTMAYHSQQVLLMRNEQEKHLDGILKRKEPDKIFQNPHIKKQLAEARAENVIYILVATPVEEVGRDHDFDWAAVEPSSYRSIIQLAGRVLRHRKKSPEKPNMAIMQYNIKSFLQENHEGKPVKPVFCHPGYETCDDLFETHDLKKLVNEESLKHSVDAIPRVQQNQELNRRRNLVDLEHHKMEQSLNQPNAQGAGHLPGWFSEYYWLTGIPQKLYRFRDSKPSENIYLIPEDEDLENYKFKVKSRSGYWNKVEEGYRIEHDDSWQDDKKRLWLNRDYSKLLVDIAKKLGLTPKEAAKRYGELSFVNYNDSERFIYSPQFGLVRKKWK